eukprot:Awhi_evm1s9843
MKAVRMAKGKCSSIGGKKQSTNDYSDVDPAFAGKCNAKASPKTRRNPSPNTSSRSGNWSSSASNRSPNTSSRSGNWSSSASFSSNRSPNTTSRSSVKSTSRPPVDRPPLPRTSRNAAPLTFNSRNSYTNTSSSPTNIRKNPPPVPAQISWKNLKKCVATHKYFPQRQGDLEFEVGDEIFVISDQGGWWVGRNRETGLAGTFPSCYCGVYSISNV